MTHTPEPWTWQDYRPHDDHAFIYPATGKGTVGTAMTNADAARIAACVNACAGIPTDHLAGAPAGALAKVVEAAALVETLCDAIRDEVDARHAYEDRPADRGGSYGPKGRALAKWQQARATMIVAAVDARAALAALRGGW